MIENPFAGLVRNRIPSVTYSQKYRKQFFKSQLNHDFQELTDNVVSRSIDWFRHRPVSDQSRFLTGMLLTQRQLVEGVLDQFLDGKPLRTAEFGCGVYGRFYNYFLSKQHKSGHIQFDINPKFVETNKRFTLYNFFKWPDVYVGNIYDMPLEDKSVDAIIGLSSWDSIAGPERTVPEIKRCLKPGGYFMHFQDVIPADYPVLIAEIRKREGRRLEPKFECEYICRTISPIDGYYFREELLVGVESIDTGRVETSSRYLTQNLADVCKEGGMEVCLNEELSTTAMQKKRRHNRLSWRIRVIDNCNGKNVIGVAPCDDVNYSYDSSIPLGYVKTSAKMDVLVVRKD